MLAGMPLATSWSTGCVVVTAWPMTSRAQVMIRISKKDGLKAIVDSSIVSGGRAACCIAI